MSYSTQRHSSQDSSRLSSSYVVHRVEALIYSPLVLAGPNLGETPLSHASFEQSSLESYPVYDYPSLDASPQDLISTHLPPSFSKPTSSLAFVSLHEDSIKAFSRNAPDRNPTVAQRDLGFVSLSSSNSSKVLTSSRYSYISAPMTNQLQYGLDGPTYYSLAPLSSMCLSLMDSQTLFLQQIDYYAQPQLPRQTPPPSPPQQPRQRHQHNRNYSSSSFSASSLPIVNERSHSGDSDDDSSPRQRRRPSQREARRQNKLRVRRNHQPDYFIDSLNGGALAPARCGPLVLAPLPPAIHSDDGGDFSSAFNSALHYEREKPQCWAHGCNGREFSTFSNLIRHEREKSGFAAKSYCPHCHAEFTRSTARNGHIAHGRCRNRKDSDSSDTVTVDAER